MRRGIEHRRIPVGIGEGLRQGAGRQPLDLVEYAAHCLGVQVLVRRRAKKILPRQHFEQVELDVTQVALEMGHVSTPQRLQWLCKLLVSNISILPSGNYAKRDWSGAEHPRPRAAPAAGHAVP